jgi:hypothetical protein
MLFISGEFIMTQGLADKAEKMMTVNKNCNCSQAIFATYA